MSGGLREHLQAIYNENGKLTPDLVVRAARNENHPLHHRFDWNDTTAAQSWRRTQAAQLIRVARIVYREADERNDQRSVRAFHAIRTERGHVYEPAHAIAADPFKRRLVLNDMQREWEAMKRRYAQFAEFTDMVRKDFGGEDAA